MTLRITLTNVFLATSVAALAQWSELGLGMNDGVRRLLYDSASQRVHAFGHFSTAGGLLVNGTAYWEDEAWHPMGQGVHYPQAFPVIGANFWGDSILIAGLFPYAIGVPDSRRLALWNGSNWLPIGTGGTNGYVPAFAQLEDGVLFAGNMDTLAGAPIANNVARYANGTWSSGCTYPTVGDMWFTTLAYYQGRYILAGNLNSPIVYELGWLDGDTLRQVGQGIRGDAWVNDLQEFQGKLYIAGDYNVAAGNAATSLSTWDGQQFADPFPGLNFITQAIDLDMRNGELYFSGRTWLPGSPDYYTLGRYDGERLCLFGKNLNTVFLSIAATEDYLYVAPNMITLGLGGDTVNYIARWDLSYPGDTCIQIATSVHEPPVFGSEWSIGPSPFNGEINLSSASGIPAGSMIVVLDATGRLIHRGVLAPAGPNEQRNRRIDNGVQGLVVVQVCDAMGHTLARRRLVRLPP